MGSVAAVTNCGNMMWRLWIIVMVLSCECLVSAQDYYEPVWSGKRCREDESVDVGRGSGSCNSDCDCPLCAPYCSWNIIGGYYCQNHQHATYGGIGRRKCSLTTCPSSRPCRRGKECKRPRCNRTGRCWCPK